MNVFKRFYSKKIPTISYKPHKLSSDELITPSHGYFKKVEPNSKDINLNPRQINEKLNEYVVGQEKLKKLISVAVYNHYKRLDFNERNLDFVEKSNVLIFGPTGTGKTLIVKTIAQILNVPYSINDASPLTQTGYVGDDVDVCIHRLLQNADYDISRAEKGIVFIDEIDKLARRNDLTNPNQRDVSGEGVQQALLRLLEGTVVSVSPKPHRGGFVPSSGQTFNIDTSNILFICSGAFVGLDKIVNDRISAKTSIGFNSNFKEAASYDNGPEPEDVIKFGFIPEFIGRIPCFVSSEALTVGDLLRILTEPKNALVKQYQQLFECSNLELLFSEQALLEIARSAHNTSTGARGLRRIMEKILVDPLYEFAGSELHYIVVTHESVTLQRPVLAFYRDEFKQAHQAAGISCIERQATGN